MLAELAMPTSPDPARIDAVRRFSRFYTRRLDVLGEHLLDSAFTLSESRVIYEIAQNSQTTAQELTHAIGLDPSYLSRILRKLENAGVVQRTPVVGDRRSAYVALTPAGRSHFARLDHNSKQQVSTLLEGVGEDEQRALITSMASIEQILTDSPDAGIAKPWLLRPHRAGDIGWVISRHGALYAQEYGWDSSFEALVAEIAGKFLRDFDSAHACCWIAERDGQNIGSAFVVRESGEVAKLRLVIVEPSARGLGVGKRLVAECIRFATDKGYSSLVLWTNDILHAARSIYVQAGFSLIEEERHHSFGHDLVGQYWALALR